MPRFNRRRRAYSFVLGVIGVAVAFSPMPDGTVDPSRTSVIQTLDMQWEPAEKLVASLGELVANWPDGPCAGSDEQARPIRDLWNIGIPHQPERPIGYSVLDGCTPIFVARGGKHSNGDLARETGMIIEGLYEKTATGGRIEVNPDALMHSTERYRAVVLGHEELHAVLEWLDPTRLNEAILPAGVITEARIQLREAGYENADVDDEILPRLLTHDPDGNGVNGVAREDLVIRGAMERLLAESQADPELKRIYWHLQRSHALMHDLMSGKAGIGALLRDRAQRPSKSQSFATPTSRFRRSMRRAD